MKRQLLAVGECTAVSSVGGPAVEWDAPGPAPALLPGMPWAESPIVIQFEDDDELDEDDAFGDDETADPAEAEEDEDFLEDEEEEVEGDAEFDDDDSDDDDDF